MAIPTTGSKDSDEIRETEERFNHSSEGEIRTKDQEGIENEVKATIEMGQMLGINLQNKEELIRMEIQGEGLRVFLFRFWQSIDKDDRPQSINNNNKRAASLQSIIINHKSSTRSWCVSDGTYGHLIV
ncbi:hypothetical protein L1987_37908 [Smallanthus sonchifolius]|uniref:Uncharacterized protein n=1 Tax=Smallanthus sonchifolius TaxID=185202 RepID=A0ACB9HI18_9ASTR|nr:hypothetical protein L1987_37908 [Smallanthus sonchifolius]